MGETDRRNAAHSCGACIFDIPGPQRAGHFCAVLILSMTSQGRGGGGVSLQRAWSFSTLLSLSARGGSFQDNSWEPAREGSLPVELGGTVYPLLRVRPLRISSCVIVS